MTEIKYVDKKMIEQWGAQPRKVPQEFAERMSKLGVARIVNTVPMANPGVECDTLDDHIASPHYVVTHEMAYWDHICWIGKLEYDLFDLGEQCGFKINYIEGKSDEITEMLLCDLIIISTDAVELSMPFWNMVKVCLFQKSTRFVMWVKDPLPYSLLNAQLFNRSELNIFMNKHLAIQTASIFGGLFIPSLIEPTHYEVWRAISDLC